MSYNSAISIHALREEGDVVQGHSSEYTIHFYPRPPRGGRQNDCAVGRLERGFLSTPSARRATRQIKLEYG